jgi:hypothetical protein
MILGYDKGTEKRYFWGKFTYKYRKKDNWKTKK